jgi:hypothetical protein
MTQPHSLNRANSINIVMAERLMGKGFGVARHFICPLVILFVTKYSTPETITAKGF